MENANSFKGEKSSHGAGVVGSGNLLLSYGGGVTFFLYLRYKGVERWYNVRVCSLFLTGSPLFLNKGKDTYASI